MKKPFGFWTATGPGRELAVGLEPLESAEVVAAALAEVTEMVSLLADRGNPSVGGLRDLRPALRQLHAAGTWLRPETLLEVLSSVEAARECRGYFLGRESAPRLAAEAVTLVDLKELRRALKEAVGPRGEILDSASFRLGDLRREILQLRGRIKRSLEQLLNSDRLAGVFQDRIITERGGRYVVPVRADHRGQLKGFIHDESSSGQTLFLEPVTVLEWNNELQTLLREEKREEERVLLRLSDQVRQVVAELASNQAILARFDFLAAAARFSRLCEGAAPRLSAKPLLELKQARHPLLLFGADGTLRPKGAVPVDLVLGEGADTLVISGPNTGGKTVALKTLGLLMLMVRSGLHIPCHPDSRVGLFARVFADIGDEQSIEASLSTFSGHLTRIGRILEQADERSLVLLDEVGTGTDPAEGGALAMAILDRLRQSGARTVVTTHLNLVKGYAQLQDGVENAAVEFDSRTLAPSYRLHYGIPGASNAFTIARLLGFPEPVLERAGHYLGSDEREGLELLEKLNELRKELEQDRAEAALLKRRASQDRERRKQLLKELDEQKRGILDKASRRGEQLVREAEGRLKGLLREARELSGDARQQARLSGNLQEVRQQVVKSRPEPDRRGRVPTEVAPGEILRVTALGTEGEVVKVLSGAAELSVHGKKLRLPLSSLEQFSPPRFAAKGKGGGKIHGRIERQGFEPKLMLIGKRAEEALLLLDRFLDDALLHQQRQLEVVHGAGEGILRRAVRDFLAGHREVSAFHAADLAHGGDNVTIVELKS